MVELLFKSTYKYNNIKNLIYPVVNKLLKQEIIITTDNRKIID